MPGTFQSAGKPDVACEAAAIFGLAGRCDDCELIRESDHRIANHLALLASFVRLKAADLARRPAVDGADAALLLESIQSQIGAMARLHRALATSWSAVPDLSEHLRELCGALAKVSDARVEIVQDLPAGCFVPPRQIAPLVQMIAEALANAIKHACPPEAGGLILVRARRDAIGALRVEVVDNGPGLPDRFDPEVDGGLGFRLLRTLGKQIGARIAFDSGRDGLRFRLTLPPTPA